MRSPNGGEVATPVNSYDVLADVANAAADALDPGQAFYILGGTVSGVLERTDTVLDKSERLVIAPPDIELSTLRPNGSRRDIDILVRAVLPPETGLILKQNVQEAVGGNLIVSAFGMDAYETAPSRGRRLGRSLMDWVSRRTIDEAGTLRYEIFPFEVAVQAESYEPWNLRLHDGTELPMLNPAAHVLAYGLRSIAYIREKDSAKVGRMREHVLPQFMEEIRDGELREWDQFAELLHEIRDGGVADASFARTDATVAELHTFSRKSRAMHWLEVEHPGLISFGQGDVAQRLLNPFTRAA